MLRRLACILAYVLAFAVPLYAARVQVVVALRSSSTKSSAVVSALHDATRLDNWSPLAFSAEIDDADVERLRSDPRVRAVSVDTGGHAALRESLPLIGVDRVHALGFEGDGITVAIVDSGIDLTNPDFADRIVAEQCFCDNLGTGCCPNGATEQSGPGAARDDNGHGTNVAGILAGGGASAPAGVAPHAHIVAVRALDRDARFASFGQVYRALSWIADTRPDVRVINLSLGTSRLFATSECNADALALALAPVVARLRKRGVLITASSGNEGSTSGVTMPACMTDVLGIGATWDHDGNYPTPFNCTDANARVDDVTCFSNATDAVDLVAPGAPITASRRGGGEVTYYGTSMAAPHVAGTIALLLEASGGLDADALEDVLKETGRPVPDHRTNRVFPRIDAAAALAAVQADRARYPRRRAVHH
ncbi:MAG: S8 family serine peptidase [Acidobacteria bacterium]|nr:S8 family serine peptidase [Acidobacteriota bacterium]MBV9475246.1 S8 family serine peptidase [Acidobacteriota bacterium]